jgi:hypothetical protein
MFAQIFQELFDCMVDSDADRQAIGELLPGDGMGFRCWTPLSRTMPTLNRKNGNPES